MEMFTSVVAKRPHEALRQALDEMDQATGVRIHSVSSVPELPGYNVYVIKQYTSHVTK